MSESTVFLKFKPQGGAHRFFFRDPDTGNEFQAANKGELIKHIVTYREQNGLPKLEELNTVIENFLCFQPENLGQCEPRELHRSLLGTIRGGVALLQNVFIPEHARCSQEEAERRAKICSTCPLNMAVGGDQKPVLAAWGDKVAEASLHGSKTPDNDKLFTCAVCGCPLKVITYHKEFAKEPEDKKAKYPDFCWKKPLV